MHGQGLKKKEHSTAGLARLTQASSMLSVNTLLTHCLRSPVHFSTPVAIPAVLLILGLPLPAGASRPRSFGAGAGRRATWEDPSGREEKLQRWRLVSLAF